MAAKFSVSALMFDYVLTGPISGVSAGLYLAALINELGVHFHVGWMHVPAALFAAVFAGLVTLYFWYTNRVGVPFSSTRALRIMQATTVMVVVLIGWCLYTILTKGFQPVPAPVPANFHFSESALGWLKGTALPGFTFVAVAIGLGHSVLALSGEETLAQVNREIEAPKQKNLERTGFIVFLYSLLFTSLVSFFAVMLIPDAVRGQYLDNLIGGLAMVLAGPFWLRLLFHGFVVLVGVLILSGAVNTAIIGSNGVLNRVAEDGILPPWFREPHPKYGTSHHTIAVIVGLQLLTIALSRGNVDMLGEAYAFGVIWSFAMKGLAVVVAALQGSRCGALAVSAERQSGTLRGAGRAGADDRDAVSAGVCEPVYEEDGDDFRMHLHAGVLYGFQPFRKTVCEAGTGEQDQGAVRSGRSVSGDVAGALSAGGWRGPDAGGAEAGSAGACW